MIGTLYRYPHPYDSDKFLYVGQGPDRDKRHRYGLSSFGRRFKKLFPGVELPQPIKEQIEVSNQIELNEEETIWMFRYHTWRGYPGGMNLSCPGLQDYKNLVGFLSQEDRMRGASNGGKKGGRYAVENRTGIFSPGYDNNKDRRRGGQMSRCTRVNLKRGKPCTCGYHDGYKEAAV